MTIGSENVYYLMVPEVIIEVGPHPAWLPSPSQTYLFFIIFQNLSKDLFQLKIESHFDILMSTVPPYIGLVVPFLTITEVHHPDIVLTLSHFISSKSEDVPIAYIACLSSSTWKPSLLTYWVVLKGLRQGELRYNNTRFGIFSTKTHHFDLFWPIFGFMTYITLKRWYRPWEHCLEQLCVYHLEYMSCVLHSVNK